MLGIKIFGLLIGYSFACISFGLLIYRVLVGKKYSEEAPLVSEAVVFSTAFLMGQGVLATLWMLLSVAGWFTPIIVKILVILAACSGLILLPKHVVGLWAHIKRIYFETRSDSWAWQGIAVLCLLFCLAGATSLGAPLLEDAANFYMTQPKVVADSYHYPLLPFKDVYYSGGFQGEMNHAVFMSLGSADAARLFDWPSSLAGAALLLALCSRMGIKRRGQWMALAMFVTSSLINTLVGKGKIDLFPMAMGLGAYYWITHKGSASHRLTGLLASFAVLGKTVYAVTLLPVFVILLIWQQFQDEPKNNSRAFMSGLMRDGFELGFWGMLTMLPLIFYNYMLFQNSLKINSLLSSFLGWKELTQYVPPYIYTTYPLYVTFGRIRHGQLGNLSALVLMFLPLVVLIPRPKSWKKSLLVAVTASAALGMVIYIIFFPTLIAPRYFSSCMFLFIPLAAGTGESVTFTESHNRVLSFVILASLYIVLTATFLENTQGGYYDNFFPKQTVVYLKGNIPDCGLESWTAPRCRALTAVNNQASPGDRVLSNLYHNYYMRSDLLLCSNAKSPSIYGVPYDKTWTPKWDLIFQEGFRFLIVDKLYNPFPHMDNPPQWVNPVKIFNEGDLMVYRLDYINPPGKPQLSCQKTDDGNWIVVHQ